MQYAVDARRGLDLLGTLPEIDPGRIGLVGYSAGAWVGAYLAGVEGRIDAYVLTPVNRWPCLRTSCQASDVYGYGSLPSQPELERYLDDTVVLDAELYVAHNDGAAFLFQAAKDDHVGSVATIRALFEAAPPPKTLRWYEGGHSLGCRGVHGPCPAMVPAMGQKTRRRPGSRCRTSALTASDAARLRTTRIVAFTIAGASRSRSRYASG